MNGWTVAAFLVGWMVGTFMSWRKILADRRRAVKTQAAIATRLGGRSLYDFLKEFDIVKITVSEDGDQELTIDQVKLDQMLGNTDKKH